MLEFKTIEELKPNPKLLEFSKGFTYKTKKGKIKITGKKISRFIFKF